MGVAAIHSLYTAGDLGDPAHPPLQLSHTHTHTQCREISLHMQFSSSPCPLVTHIVPVCFTITWEFRYFHSYIDVTTDWRRNTPENSSAVAERKQDIASGREIIQMQLQRSIKSGKCDFTVDVNVGSNRTTCGSGWLRNSQIPPPY